MRERERERGKNEIGTTIVFIRLLDKSDKFMFPTWASHDMFYVVRVIIMYNK